MTIKLAAVLARLSAGERIDVTAVSARLGISRTSFYKYRDRFVADGVEGLLPRSRRPHSCPWQTPAEVEDTIASLRKRLAEDGWDNGAVSISYAMLDAGTVPPSPSTIHRVLRRRGLVVDAPAKRPRSSWQRFEFPRGNDCWQIDAFEWLLADGSKAAVFQVIDDHSRTEVDSYAARSENGDAAWACWMRAVEGYGVPAMVLSDNGGAFSGARQGWTVSFERNVRALGTRTVTSSPYHPQTCGKDERAHQTQQRWLRARPAAATLGQLQTQLDTYRPLYNARRHQGINGQTPAQRYATAERAAPEQPEPAEQPVLTTTGLVSDRGSIGVDGHEIGLGRQWCRTRLTVIRQADQVAIFHGQTLVRELTLDRTHRYQPTGNPRGGRRLRRYTP